MLLFYWLSLALTILIIFNLFFRREAKFSCLSPGEIMSPAEGKIVDIEEDQSYLYLSIALNLWNVHRQYLSLKGKVVKIEQQRGEFNLVLPGNISKVIKKNNRVTTTLVSEYGWAWQIVQLSGKLARRIKVFVQEDKTYEAGACLGLIELGSLVILALPKKYVEVLAKIGDKVKVGTPIAIIQKTHY